MRLRGIEVRDFRKLRHTVVEGLGDGLNVVVGDNEAGKSTLLEALRAALFERHRVTGDTAQAMLPFGQQVRPEVIVDFEIAGKPWRLRKAFVKKPEAELEGPGERLAGDAVEERLAQLFGFTPPGRGGSKPAEHQGAHGLLWVEQGAAHRPLGVGAGRDSIAAALENEVGQVLGGERGRVLLAAADRRRADFWTPTGRPKGDWKKLADEVEARAADRDRLEQEFMAYDDKVTELGRRQEELARYQREGHLAQAGNELVRARAAMAETERLDQTHREAGERHKRATVECEAALAQRNGRSTLVAATATAGEALLLAQGESQEAAIILAQRTEVEREASRRLAEARAVRLAAEERSAGIEEALRRQRTREEVKELDVRLAACEEAEGKRRTALAAATAITVTPNALRTLEELQKAADQAEARLQAASVRLTFEPDGRRAIRIDGADHESGRPLRLARDAELSLDGFGLIRIQPGGGVADLARRSETTTQALEDALRAHGAPNLSEARSEIQRKAEVLQEAEGQGRVVAALAPGGIGALTQTIADRRALLARPLPPAAADLGEVTEATLTLAQDRQEAVVKVEQTEETAVRQAETARAGAEIDAARAEERANGAARDHEARLRELTDARAQAPDEQLAEALAQAERALEAEARAAGAARAALDAADPEVARLRLQKAERAEAAIRADIDRLTREKRDLEVELGALGRNGVGERLAEAEGDLALKQSRLARANEQAEASRLLHDVLNAAQRESKDRWLGPVRHRVAPYLRLLHPDSDIVLNEETLELEGMVRNGRAEPFEDLSTGAREQVAVITRLALAEILRGAGHPAAVILDDALVNTDEERLERMHLVLHRAAEQLQVLVLTCRERDFIGLGAPIVRMR